MANLPAVAAWPRRHCVTTTKQGYYPHRHEQRRDIAYDPDVLPRLAFIRSAQAVGLSLREIREVIGIRDLGTAPCAHVLEPSCGGPDAYPRAPAIGARSHATCRARCGTGSSGVRCRRRLQGHPRWDWLAACSARGRFAAEEKKRASSDFRPAVIHPPRSEYL